MTISLVLCLQVLLWEGLPSRAAAIDAPTSSYTFTGDIPSTDTINVSSGYEVINQGYTVAAPITLNKGSVQNNGTISDITVADGDCYVVNRILTNPNSEGTVTNLTARGTDTTLSVSYGETLNPIYSSSTNTTTPTVEYKLETQDDTAYTTTVPTAAGSYNARVTYPATTSHTEATKTTSFNINYLPGEGSVTVEDVIFGLLVTPVLESNTNDVAKTTFLYIYKEVILTDDFVISYLELPKAPYTIQGTLGENNIYTSEVSIIPAE